MNTEFIQLKEVTKKFKKNVVLEKVDLNIPEKQITGIIGASGMGKTTILKMIMGFYKPTKGQIVYLKRNVLKDLKNIRKIFGFSTEDGSFYQDLTVKENLYHFGSLYGMKKNKIKERTKEILDFVGLSKAVNTRAGDVSVGMKKRLDFACSLIHEPEVLILDEPTADLDPLLRAQILSLIKKIKNRGTTVVLTTQLLEEMDEICDYIAILHGKKIIEKDTPKKIKEKYSCKSLNEVFEKIFSKKEDSESEPGEKRNKGTKKARTLKFSGSKKSTIDDIKRDTETKEKEDSKTNKELKEKKDSEINKNKESGKETNNLKPEKEDPELKKKQEMEKKILSNEKKAGDLLGKLFSGKKENKNTSQINKKTDSYKKDKNSWKGLFKRKENTEDSKKVNTGYKKEFKK